MKEHDDYMEKQHSMLHGHFKMSYYHDNGVEVDTFGIKKPPPPKKKKHNYDDMERDPNSTTARSGSMSMDSLMVARRRLRSAAPNTLEPTCLINDIPTEG